MVSTQQEISKKLDVRIYERVVKRLGRRVRNLGVHVKSGTVRVVGECSTYYTKQLVQQAVLGLIENETVINDIVVMVPFQPKSLYPKPR